MYVQTRAYISTYVYISRYLSIYTYMSTYIYIYIIQIPSGGGDDGGELVGVEGPRETLLPRGPHHA